MNVCWHRVQSGVNYRWCRHAPQSSDTCWTRHPVFITCCRQGETRTLLQDYGKLYRVFENSKAKTITLDLQCTAVSLQSTKQTFCFTHCEYQFTQMSVFYCITWNQHKKRSMLELEKQATKVAQSTLTRQTHSSTWEVGSFWLQVRRLSGVQ